EVPTQVHSFYRVVFSPSGLTVAAGDDSGVVHLYDTGSGTEIATYPADKNAAYDVSFSADGARLATSGADGEARLWDIASGRQLQAAPGTPPLRTAGPWQVAISPDGSHLAVVDYREAYLWDTASGREVRRFTGHTNDVL